MNRILRKASKLPNKRHAIDLAYARTHTNGQKHIHIDSISIEFYSIRSCHSVLKQERNRMHTNTYINADRPYTFYTTIHQLHVSVAHILIHTNSQTVDLFMQPVIHIEIYIPVDTMLKLTHTCVGYACAH